MTKSKNNRQKVNYQNRRFDKYQELQHYIVEIVKVKQEPIHLFLKNIRNVSTPNSTLRCKIDFFGIILDKSKYEGIKRLYITSDIHEDTLKRINFLRFMLITFDEKLFLNEYKNKQRNVDSTTQNEKVTSKESLQNVIGCNEKNCYDVDLRLYIQGINDGMDILISLRKIPGIKLIENKIAMFQVILHNSDQIDLLYNKNMIKCQTYQRIW